MDVIWQSEIDPSACAILRQHWPGVPNLGDVHGITGTVERPDLICGGFPCQPFSTAARGRNKSNLNLWPEMLRVIQECQPAWVCGENVAHIDGLALEQVCSDLEACGYEVAPPLEIPACAVDADHIRARLWILGYSDRNRQSRMREHAEVAGLPRGRDDTGGMGAPHGIPGRLDRMRCLGNSLHVGIAEQIGRAIMAVA